MTNYGWCALYWHSYLSFLETSLQSVRTVLRTSAIGLLHVAVARTDRRNVT